jgi:hypothetical protein
MGSLGEQRTKEREAILASLLSILSFQGIAFCLLLSFLLVNLESTFMLLVFNLLFASLTFPLKGTLTQKISLLFLGNVIGSFWNFLFHSFAFLGVSLFGGFFNVLCLILNPFANLMWIVSFWSLSLTILTRSESGKLGMRIDT